MGDNFLQQFVADTQKEVNEALEKLAQENKIKEQVLAHAQDYAKTAATHILDPKPENELKPLPVVPIDNEDRFKYLLVLEFLQSAGFKFAPSVLKFESQHPDIECDRRQLGKELGLRTYDRTPYLVQLIEKARESSAA
jgi:hypothetical protein